MHAKRGASVGDYEWSRAAEVPKPEPARALRLPRWGTSPPPPQLTKPGPGAVSLTLADGREHSAT